MENSFEHGIAHMMMITMISFKWLSILKGNSQLVRIRSIKVPLRLKQVCALINIYNKIKLNEVELYTGFEGVQNDTLQLELRFINIYFNFKYI